MRSAPMWKKIWHHFWLFQPILQFLTLLAVLVILSRCSPLSPSTSRDILDKAAGAGAQAPTTPKAAEDLLEVGLKEVPALDVQLVDEHKYADMLSRGIYVGASHDNALMDNRHKQITEWRLTREQILELAVKSEIKVPAHTFWAKMDAEKRTALVRRLKTLLDNEQLKALVFLVSNDFDADSAEQKVEISVSLDLNIVNEEQALLVIKREHAETEALDEVHKAKLQQAKFLAVVLGE